MDKLSGLKLVRTPQWLLRNAIAFFCIVFLAGCVSAPRMQNVAEATADTRIVFGSAAVYVDDKLQKWGITWSGESHFYLLILPSDSAVASSYDLSKDGDFYWALAPGEYTLLGYHWQKGTEQRSGDIRARFVVPEAGGDSYIGALEFRGNNYSLWPFFIDRYDQAQGAYDAKFPARRGTSVKRLMDAPQPVGNHTAVIPQCHASWGIDCSDRFRGVTPTSPHVSSSGFPTLQTLTPEFRWKGCGRKDVSYDFVLYEAATFTTTGIVEDFVKGHMVAYAEDLKDPAWKPETPFRPGTRYFWSVRLRDGDTVSAWSTQSHSSFMIVAWSSGYGQWFQFKTA